MMSPSEAGEYDNESTDKSFMVRLDRQTFGEVGCK